MFHHKRLLTTCNAAVASKAYGGCCQPPFVDFPNHGNIPSYESCQLWNHEADLKQSCTTYINVQAPGLAHGISHVHNNKTITTVILQ